MHTRPSLRSRGRVGWVMGEGESGSVASVARGGESDGAWVRGMCGAEGGQGPPDKPRERGVLRFAIAAGWSWGALSRGSVGRSPGE